MIDGFCIIAQGAPMAMLMGPNEARNLLTHLVISIYKLGREAGIHAERNGKPDEGGIDLSGFDDLLSGIKGL